MYIYKFVINLNKFERIKYYEKNSQFYLSLCTTHKKSNNLKKKKTFRGIIIKSNVFYKATNLRGCSFWKKKYCKNYWQENNLFLNWKTSMFNILCKTLLNFKKKCIKNDKLLFSGLKK